MSPSHLLHWSLSCSVVDWNMIQSPSLPTCKSTEASGLTQPFSGHLRLVIFIASVQLSHDAPRIFERHSDRAWWGNTTEFKMDYQSIHPLFHSTDIYWPWGRQVLLSPHTKWQKPRSKPITSDSGSNVLSVTKQRATLFAKTLLKALTLILAAWKLMKLQQFRCSKKKNYVVRKACMFAC